MGGSQLTAVAFALVCAAGLGLLAGAQPPDQPGAGKVVLVVHGGSGVLPRKELTPALERQYLADLEEALRAGHDALQRKGGTCLDGVEAAIKVLEDSPRFNAGKGAVFTGEGRNELDASIMEGKEKRAGAVAAVTRVKNPIAAARAVMEKTRHVLLVGPGADRFAAEAGLEMVDPSYFKTERRWQEWKEAVRREGQKPKGKAPPPKQPGGTVGAVALDRHGNLAAGTSTGGLTNRLPGRVGDSPIIGAGTYCDNAACGVSCTGHGELFIRHAVAHEVVALMRHKELSLQDATAEALRRLPADAGGLIALDRRGNVAMPFNTDGMYRGYIRDRKTHVMIR
ncbi:MAG: isoaspartyl peptidase/L-asparaginase [Gemmataceae bacterium]|nr:isoaspartyl peptidase/L-asparaginase [Gemmataceae bacterium]